MRYRKTEERIYMGQGKPPQRVFVLRRPPLPKYGPSNTQATGKALTSSGRGDANSGGKAAS